MNHRIEIHDEDDDLGMGCATIDVDVEFVVHRGDPGCRYTANGDGWPPTPDEVEIIRWRAARARSATDGWTITLLCGQFSFVDHFVARKIEADRETIDGKLLEFAEDVA